MYEKLVDTSWVHDVAEWLGTNLSNLSLGTGGAVFEDLPGSELELAPRQVTGNHNGSVNRGCPGGSRGASPKPQQVKELTRNIQSWQTYITWYDMVWLDVLGLTWPILQLTNFGMTWYEVTIEICQQSLSQLWSHLTKLTPFGMSHWYRKVPKSGCLEGLPNTWSGKYKQKTFMKIRKMLLSSQKTCHAAFIPQP